jgi:hypothetical protein
MRTYLFEAANVLLTRVSTWSTLKARGMRLAKQSHQSEGRARPQGGGHPASPVVVDSGGQRSTTRSASGGWRRPLPEIPLVRLTIHGGRCSNPGENSGPGSGISWRVGAPGELAQSPTLRVYSSSLSRPIRVAPDALLARTAAMLSGVTYTCLARPSCPLIYHHAEARLLPAKRPASLIVAAQQDGYVLPARVLHPDCGSAQCGSPNARHRRLGKGSAFNQKPCDGERLTPMVSFTQALQLGPPVLPLR